MHPILLVGAALVGLPILLHLIMKQEPKRLSFPAFRFLTQKLKTNQRKMRLRHFLLLALRMLVIALFCLTLYQPTLMSERLNLRGEQPVAVVLVIDTSPSMGYTADGKTRLDEARRRARELLDELPEKSVVAVVDTAGATAFWGDVADARKALDQLDQPRGGSQPLAPAIAEAYHLLAKVESRESDEADQFPKLLAVLTDRATASWNPDQTENLKKLRDAIPGPKPAHAVIDVGPDHPTNVAILSAEMKPQVIPANQPAAVVVTVAATGPADGPAAEVVVKAKLDGNAADRKGVNVPNGQTRAVNFEFRDLKPGLHQVEFSLEAADKLASDNTRFLTFQVGSARRILTISDEPEGAVFWQIAHQSKGEFGCLVVTPAQVQIRDGRTVVVPDPAKENQTEDVREFEVVCLLNVADPNQKIGLDTLWDKLGPYVRGGGKLVIVPGGENLSRDGYAEGKDLMPGAFKDVIDTRKVDPPPPKQTAPGWDAPRDGKNGVTWFTGDRVTQHPMLRPFQAWEQKGNVDVVKNPRRARKYWLVEKDREAAVVVAYNDAEKPADRRPAVIERTVAGGDKKGTTRGKVLLLTTRLDVQPPDEAWNDYWEYDSSTWHIVFPWLIARYMAGDTADANFNFPAGQTVIVPLPKGGVPKGTKVQIEGGNISSADTLIEVGDRQTELRIGPPRTNQPGNYELLVEAVKWRDGFSLNVPAEESKLEKVPAEGIEELTGKDTVVQAEKELKLIDILGKIEAGKQPVDLFPWLLILVLMLLVAEGFVANRFYRRVR